MWHGYCIRLNLPELTVGTVASKNREFRHLSGTFFIIAHVGLVRYALFWLGRSYRQLFTPRTVHTHHLFWRTKKLDKGAETSRRANETFYIRVREVPPKTGWLTKAWQKVCKAGRRDIVVDFGTVPPKAGRLRPMVLSILPSTCITTSMNLYDGLHVTWVLSILP